MLNSTDTLEVSTNMSYILLVERFFPLILSIERLQPKPNEKGKHLYLMWFIRVTLYFGFELYICSAFLIVSVIGTQLTLSSLW